MNWRLAAHRAWRLPVIWEASQPEPSPVEATVVHVVYVAAPLAGPRLPGPLAAIARSDQGEDQ